MYYIVRAFFLLQMIILLSSCSDSNIRVNLVQSSYETDKVSAKITLPQLEYRKNQEFADEICRDLSEIAKSLAENSAKKAEERNTRASVKIDSAVSCNSNELISILIEGEINCGGAHSEKFRVCRTYDFKTARRLFLEDIFIDDAWKKAIDAELLRRVEEENEYKELWEMPSSKNLNFENFYLRNNGEIVFFYPPYDLSYYRRSFVEFSFTKEEISGYIRPEFRI